MPAHDTRTLRFHCLGALSLGLGMSWNRDDWYLKQIRPFLSYSYLVL